MINNERLFHNLQRLVAMYRISCETKMLILNTRESVNERTSILRPPENLLESGCIGKQQLQCSLHLGILLSFNFDPSFAITTPPNSNRLKSVIKHLTDFDTKLSMWVRWWCLVEGWKHGRLRMRNE